MSIPHRPPSARQLRLTDPPSVESKKALMLDADFFEKLVQLAYRLQRPIQPILQDALVWSGVLPEARTIFSVDPEQKDDV